MNKKQIVYRINGGTSVVQASAARTPEELAFGIGFLLHHNLYKRSKAGGVTAANAREVLAVLDAAREEFQTNVVDRLEGKAKAGELSGLGAGVVKNPFDYVGG